MKANHGVVGHFLSIFLGAVLFQIWYPQLVFLTPPDTIQEIIMRGFASFSFYGNPSAFWILFTLSLGIGAIFAISILSSHPHEFKSYISKVLTSEFLIQFLFYVFCMNPSSRPSSPRVFLGTWFIPASLILLSGLGLLYGVIWVIYQKREKSKQSRQIKPPVPRITYTCPYCQRIFHARVSYCPSCKKNIE